MPSLRGYRISVIVLLSLLAVSSGTSVYLYELRQTDLNSSVSQSANLDKQITDLNNQIAALRIQIDQMQDTGPGSNDGLKAQIAQLTAQINALQATNASQALEIQNLRAQVQSLLDQIAKLENPTIVNGAGATFPFPFLSAAIATFGRTNPNVTINYVPAGSGFGVSQLEAQTVDFAASDQPLTATDTSKLSSPAVQIPETIGGVVIAYNLAPSITTSGLNLTAAVAAQIFSGAITTWNDPQIQKLNTITLPNVAIRVAHRSDASGTTFVFTSWLHTSGLWLANNVGKTATWAPGSYGSQGNQGVAGFIQGTNNTIGYVELNYALSPANRMTYSYVRNGDNTSYVAPKLQTFSNAVGNFTGTYPVGSGDWTSVSLLNQKGLETYPVTSLTYLMVYAALDKNPSTSTLAKAQALANFLWFIVHEGQAQAALLYYVPLPQSIVSIDEATIRGLTFNGQSLHS